MRRTACFTAFALAFALAPGALAGGPQSARHGRSTDGVFWFMHISDLHIGASLIEGPNASAHLQTALHEVVTTIQPRFVAATGDLVDGSILGVPTTGQSQGEWDTYKGAYEGAGMTPDFYFDLPGNHDGYGDKGLTHYLASSLQGKTNHGTSASWQVQTPAGRYDFYGLCSAGTGSGPFVEQPSYPADQITALSEALTLHPDAELAFVLAHHRLSEPDNGAQVVDVMRNSGAGYYLHGHVHEYTEYADGQGQIVVNEVSSLGKLDTQNIAVGVVDNNAFIYRATDVTAPWPFVIVTAPVAWNLRGTPNAHPYAYPVCKDRKDNPFRALVFAPTPPTAVTVAVAGLPAVAMTPVPGQASLWQAELDTSALAAGVVDVTVSATADGATRSDTISATFTEGPCEVLPGTPTGTGGSGGAGGAGGATGGAGGGLPTGGAGGATASGGAGGSTPSGGAGGSPPTTTPDTSSGCGCGVAERSSTPGGLAVLLALAWLGRRSRSRAGRVRAIAIG